MKIGILTYHRSHNYGALLQAYALKTYLKKLGYHVKFVDYNPRYFEWHNNIKRKNFKNLSIKAKILYTKYYFKWYYPLYSVKKKRIFAFEKFVKDFIIKDYKDYRAQSFDIVIYGSDQIWSKEPSYSGGAFFDKIYFGDSNIKANKRIAFSASMGVVDVEKSDFAFLRELFKNFDFISVREEDLYNIIKTNDLAPHIDIYKTIDPVFLLEKSDWCLLNKKRIISEPYLLFYDFQIDEITTSIAKEIAKIKKLKIVRLTDAIDSLAIYGKEKGYMPYAGPLEFISLFQYADFIVSSSFHGTAFSIIFQKQFYVRQFWNTSRVKSLLSAAGMPERFIESIAQIDLSQEINYERVDKNLLAEKCFAKDYLSKSIQ